VGNLPGQWSLVLLGDNLGRGAIVRSGLLRTCSTAEMLNNYFIMGGILIVAVGELCELMHYNEQAQYKFRICPKPGANEGNLDGDSQSQDLPDA